jgi:hypoxia up-regulated 1
VSKAFLLYFYYFFTGAFSRGIPLKIIEAELVGVQEAIGNLTEAGAKEPVVKLTVGISDSGFATLEDAIVFGEIKDDSIAGGWRLFLLLFVLKSFASGKLKNLFGAGSSSSSTDSETPEATSSIADATATATVKPPLVKDTIALTLRAHYLTVIPLSGPEKAAAWQRLVALDNAEATRRRKEEAHNMLEGYLYRLRDYLDGEQSSPFKLYSKPEERKSLERKMEEAFAWLSEHGEGAETGELWAQREGLEWVSQRLPVECVLTLIGRRALEKPIQFRYKENEDAPQELDALQQALTAGDFFLKSARENHTLEAAADLPHKYTLEELDTVEKRLNETIEWLKAGMETQKKLKKNDDPVLISAEMKARGVTLQNQVMKLLKRKNPKLAKKTTTTSPIATEVERTESSTTAEETRRPVHPEL